MRNPYAVPIVHEYMTYKKSHTHTQVQPDHEAHFLNLMIIQPITLEGLLSNETAPRIMHTSSVIAQVGLRRSLFYNFSG